MNGFTQLGLVEMTRKRTRESLAHVLCEPCPTCQGRGEIKTAQTICYEILREIVREAKQFNAREFRILAAQSVIDMFLDEESQSLAQLGDFIGKPISLQVSRSTARTIRHCVQVTADCCRARRLFDASNAAGRDCSGARRRPDSWCQQPGYQRGRLSAPRRGAWPTTSEYTRIRSARLFALEAAPRQSVLRATHRQSPDGLPGGHADRGTGRPQRFQVLLPRQAGGNR